jgi:hypothetical protein
MLFADLTACTGPACPACGCRDSEIIASPANGIVNGLAVCGNCGRQFSYTVATEAAPDAKKVAPPPNPGSELAADRRRRRWHWRWGR